MSALPSPIEPAPTSLSSVAIQLLGPKLGRDFVDGLADNTFRSYEADLKDYFAWVADDGRRWSDPYVIADYLEALANVQAAYATIARRVTSIHKLTIAVALAKDEPLTREDDPTKHPAVSLKLQALRKRLGTDQGSAEPLTGSRLLETLIAIEPDTVAGIRDRALLLIGFYGALRRSELAGMRRGHVVDDDADGLAISLPTSKASQTEMVWVPVAAHPRSSYDPVAALDTWLDVAGAAQTAAGVGPEFGSPVWLPITKGDTITLPTQAMSAASINSMVQRRVINAGLFVPPVKDDEDDTKKTVNPYSAHSLRSGFITEAKNRGIDEADIMAHTRHKSIRMMRHYDKRAGWWQRNPTTSIEL